MTVIVLSDGAFVPSRLVHGCTVPAVPHSYQQLTRDISAFVAVIHCALCARTFALPTNGHIPRHSTSHVRRSQNNSYRLSCRSRTQQCVPTLAGWRPSSNLNSSPDFRPFKFCTEMAHSDRLRIMPSEQCRSAHRDELPQTIDLSVLRPCIHSFFDCALSRGNQDWLRVVLVDRVEDQWR